MTGDIFRKAAESQIENKKAKKSKPKHDLNEICNIVATEYEAITHRTILPWKKSDTGLRERDKIYGYYINYFEVNNLDVLAFSLFVKKQMHKWFYWVKATRGNVIGFVFSDKNIEDVNKAIDINQKASGVAGKNEKWTR